MPALRTKIAATSIITCMARVTGRLRSRGSRVPSCEPTLARLGTRDSELGTAKLAGSPPAEITGDLPSDAIRALHTLRLSTLDSSLVKVSPVVPGLRIQVCILHA